MPPQAGGRRVTRSMSKKDAAGLSSPTGATGEGESPIDQPDESKIFDLETLPTTPSDMISVPEVPELEGSTLAQRTALRLMFKANLEGGRDCYGTPGFAQKIREWQEGNNAELRGLDEQRRKEEKARDEEEARKKRFEEACKKEEAEFESYNMSAEEVEALVASMKKAD